MTVENEIVVNQLLSILRNLNKCGGRLLVPVYTDASVKPQQYLYYQPKAFGHLLHCRYLRPATENEVDRFCRLVAVRGGLDDASWWVVTLVNIQFP